MDRYKNFLFPIRGGSLTHAWRQRPHSSGLGHRREDVERGRNFLSDLWPNTSRPMDDAWDPKTAFPVRRQQSVRTKMHQQRTNMIERRVYKA